MTQVQGIPYRRHGPSAALREFLDPLDPGDYFDCGRARLHGLDDALLEEARSRGRAVGDDAFLLVATDMGLIFCRPSISFAIAARWEDINLIRPRGDDPVVLPVTWPRHGELKFTLSRRLAGNIFRRWLQRRMHAARRARPSEPRATELSDGRADGGAEDGDLGDLGGDVRADAVDELEPTETVEPPASGPAETGHDLRPFESPGARTGRGTLADDQLERVTVPRIATSPPSWVGSAVSVAASLVVISTVVLIVAVSVSLWRGASGGSSDSPSSDVAGVETTPTTIDHERFRASSDPVGQVGPGETAQTTELAPSAAGGASQSLPSSSQQLLAVPPDPDPGPDPDRAVTCNSNYSGCIPDVAGTAGADVDCAGQGDGPYFATTEVMVLGDDVYGLDSDGDRLACEADQLAADPLTADPSGAAASGG